MFTKSRVARLFARLGRIVVGLALVGLGNGRLTLDAQQLASQAQSLRVHRSRAADDIARFLAGLPGTQDSPFLELESSSAWRTHRDRMDDAWKKAKTDLVGRITAFQKQELSGDWAAAPVFYPFGGPDAMTVTLLFPRSPMSVIVGLEPAGTLPSVGDISKMDMPKYLAAIRETMASELGRSFFITREMDRQFRGQVTDGLLLPILQLLVRTDHHVLGFRYVRLDEEGSVIERLPTFKAPTRYGNKGVEIEYQSDTDASLHTLYYFCVNLANDRLSENQPFQRYLSRLSDATTFLKATSYLVHRKDFSVIRESVLEHSASILQDDSGIPYKFFQPDAWDVQLYGEYDQPYGSFRFMQQPLLQKAFSESDVKPLPLRLGYGYSKIPSNLLLARRRSKNR